MKHALMWSLTALVLPSALARDARADHLDDYYAAVSRVHSHLVEHKYEKETIEAELDLLKSVRREIYAAVLGVSRDEVVAEPVSQVKVAWYENGIWMACWLLEPGRRSKSAALRERMSWTGRISDWQRDERVDEGHPGLENTVPVWSTAVVEQLKICGDEDPGSPGSDQELQGLGGVVIQG